MSLQIVLKALRADLENASGCPLAHARQLERRIKTFRNDVYAKRRLAAVLPLDPTLGRHTVTAQEFDGMAKSAPR
jgi:hypothetical protein